MNSEGRTVDVIVAVASWEPRFALGMERTLAACATRRVLLYFVREYGTRTTAAREKLQSVMENYPDVECDEHEIEFGSPSAMWRLLEEDLGPRQMAGRRVLVDLTTMPREVIWAALFWLEAAGAAVKYVYNRPCTYAEDWLARDPENPRLVYKLAGALEVGRPTALLAVTGFDENRCRQAIEFYEPSRVLLATQRGNQFGNDVRNIGREFNQSNVRIERVEVDSYCADHGYGALRGHVEELTQTHNVVLCSFGPKPSAIALFRLQREFPQAALAYIGCKEYNTEYSVGLGEAIDGMMPRRHGTE